MNSFAHDARGSRLRPAPALLSAEHVPRACVLVASAAVVVGVSADAGGYYPTAWGSVSLFALAAAALGLAVGGLQFGRRDWAALAALAGWLAVVGAGATRAGAATAGVPELERGGLYLVVLWVALIVLRRRTVEWCLAGLLVGILIVTADGLVGVLFPGGEAPDYYEGRLLFRPVGYANGMGMLAVFGIVLGLGFASHGNVLTRRLSAAALVPLGAALALTGSRGALAALVAALVLLLTFERATPLLVALALPAAAAAFATFSHVTDAAAAPAVVAHDGRLVAGAIALLTFANAAFASTRRPRAWRLPVSAAVALAAFGCVALPFMAYDRLPFWRAALADYAAHPLLGSGPGSFAAAWLRYRHVADSTVDAHSLYLQTLAEIGPIGLLALLLALAVPLSAVRHAESRYASAAAAAYAAFLLHAAVDWDWQLPAVTLVAVVLGAALIADSRRDVGGSRVPLSVAGTATALAALAACAMLIGNRALVAASHAARAQEWPQARALATQAARWEPWSAEPLLVLGEAQAATGDRAAARATFRRAARLAPDDWRARYDLALANGAKLAPAPITLR